MLNVLIVWQIYVAKLLQSKKKFIYFLLRMFITALTPHQIGVFIVEN